MGRKPKEPKRTQAYRHGEKRKNNPEAGLIEFVPKAEETSKEFCWDPRESPQLIWAGKAGMKRVEVEEAASIEVPIVNLHIHERVSTEAILRTAQRTDAQRTLFADPEMEFSKEIQFYQHDVDWSNRMILGDSLLVMNSLLEREGMRGKVQCIYMDPPYGIKYASNFQPRIDQRDVKDGKDDDLTREVMQVQAFRDTWELGVHSYLTYLRDRLLLSRELLSDSGSIFVQIGDENVHRVRCLMDEVFGEENFVAQIPFRKKLMPLGTNFLEQMADTILWCAKQKLDSAGRPHAKYRKLFRLLPEEPDSNYRFIELDDSSRRPLTKEERDGGSTGPAGARIYRLKSMEPSGPMDAGRFKHDFQGKTYGHPANGYATTPDGMKRLELARRIEPLGSLLNYVLFLDDGGGTTALTAPWFDTAGADDKQYAVQTHSDVVKRCILMTTDPGDLVLDPTCVRRGTRILVPNPAPTLPINGKGAAAPSPLAGRAGEGSLANTSNQPPAKTANQPPAKTANQPPSRTSKVSLAPIEDLQPGDFVIAHDGTVRRVLRTIRKRSAQAKYGIRCSGKPILWVTCDHKVLCKRREVRFDQHRWQEIKAENFQHAREMRNEPSKSERMLWAALRRRSLGVKFRRQHPIGPFIVDFYSRDAALVVEVDGDAHYRDDAARAYDERRDCELESKGLTVLRFTSHDVLTNVDGVLRAIQHALECAVDADMEGWQWRRAESLRVGDVVLTPSLPRAQAHTPSQPPPQAGEEFAPSPPAGRVGEGSFVPAQITGIDIEVTDEEVFDLEVEGAHSFVTETCAVHNCGSGTTATVAEQWGRRWITMDTSRVALAIARHRLMTAAFDYYKLRHPTSGVSGGFVYKTVPHITLKSIAQNREIDTIAAEFQPQIEKALAELNEALRGHKEPFVVVGGGRDEQVLDFTAPDTKTVKMPSGQEAAVNALLEWEVPRDFPNGWPKAAREPFDEFWSHKREMQAQIDESIARYAPVEELVDQPEKERGIVRVCGPFTIEAVPNVSAEVSAEVEIEVIPSDEGATEVKLFEPQETAIEAANAAAHVGNMIEALRRTGVHVRGRKMMFENLRPLDHAVVHAEGDLAVNGSAGSGDQEGSGAQSNLARCAVVFGPKNGALSEVHVRDAVRAAAPYDAILFCAYEFTAPAQEVINSNPVPGKRLMMAHIAPDTVMADLLKDTKASQLFTLIGEPDVVVYRHGEPDLDDLAADAGERAAEVRRRLKQLKPGEMFVEVRGVDLYDPVTGETRHDSGRDIHAIFIDHAYDGKSFCICQALFPNKRDSWNKIARNLKGTINEEAFEAMRTQVSLPFQPGERVQVKVIDARGNAVVKTIHLEEAIA